MDEAIRIMTTDGLRVVRVYLGQKIAVLDTQYHTDPDAALNNGVHDELLTARDWLREVEQEIAWREQS